MCNICQKRASKTEKYTYLKRRKCYAYKKSRKILRDMRDIFFPDHYLSSLSGFFFLLRNIF